MVGYFNGEFDLGAVPSVLFDRYANLPFQMRERCSNIGGVPQRYRNFRGRNYAIDKLRSRENPSGIILNPVAVKFGNGTPPKHTGVRISAYEPLNFYPAETREKLGYLVAVNPLVDNDL
jgi:hypothetical protein